jgi:hypothetical protein
VTYDYAQQTVASGKRGRNAATSTIPDEYVVRHILGSVGAGISGDRADQAGGPVVKHVEGVNVAGDRLDQFFVGRLIAHHSE